MEEFQVNELTQTAERFHALASVLLGSDRELARQVATQAFKDARVRHEQENEKAKPRKLSYSKRSRGSGKTAIRTLMPSSRRSLLLSLHEVMRVEERKQEEEWIRRQLVLDLKLSAIASPN